MNDLNGTSIRNNKQRMDNRFTKEFSLFKFINNENEFYINVYGSPQDPWFRLSDIGKVLKYRNMRDVIRNLNLPDDWRAVEIHDTLGGKQSCTFINQKGLFKIIMRSKKPIADAFQNFVCGEILPSIIQTGAYSTGRAQVDLEAERRLKIYNSVFNVFQQLGMDQRDELMFRDYGRTLMITDGTQPLNKEWPISKRVQEVFGRRGDNRLFQKIGRRVANAYRQRNSRSPLRRDQFVDGTVRTVKHYVESDFVDFIDDIIRDELGM